MNPTDIIAFCKDWSEPKTSNNHVLEELAKSHRVLWVNSVATRNPNLASANDLKKIVRKVKGWFRGAQVIHENLRILTPVTLPFPHSHLAQWLNRRLVALCVNKAVRSWGFRKPQLWTFLPNVGDFIGRFDESLVVYYCTDEWTGFSHLNAAYVRQQEAELLRKADVVFATSEKLVETKSPLNQRTFLMPHGVNFDAFAQALSPSCSVTDDLRNLPRPIIGFYGNLYDWVDQDLLAALACARPNWSFVLIGKLMTDVSALRACSNIHLFGPRPHEDLPRYCKGFDVGIIPYKSDDPRMLTVNPLKLREYLAAGLPVVSIEMPEVRLLIAHPQLKNCDVAIAGDTSGFVDKIEQALSVSAASDQQRRSLAMKSESWTARATEIERILAQVESIP